MASTKANQIQEGSAVIISHVVTIDLEVKDINALSDACRDLGLELVLGQKTYRWYGRFVGDYNEQNAANENGIAVEDYGKCDHAIRIPGNDKAYEIGVRMQANGSAKLVWDFFNGGYGMEAKVGENCGRLQKEYAYQVAVKQLRRQGYHNCQRTIASDGRIVVTARR